MSYTTAVFVCVCVSVCVSVCVCVCVSTELQLQELNLCHFWCIGLVYSLFCYGKLCDKLRLENMLS